MKILKNFILIIITVLFILSCKKPIDTKSTKIAAIVRLSNEELMKKYGPKDKNQEEINKVINSIKWTTNTDNENLASKDAVKGGTIIGGSYAYPASLRTIGENSATVFNGTLETLVYQVLLGFHSVTFEYLPGLANKWSIADDKMTFYFYINENAKWQDGEPVTAFDVAATWALAVSDGIKDPFSQDFWNKFERPAALSKNIIMVKAKTLEWSNFYYFSRSMSIFPEHIIGRIPPEQYMTEYQNKMMPGCGPYIFESAKTNEYITLKRDKAWWGYKEPDSAGTYNFDTIKFIFYTDENILEEKFRKGEVDFYLITRARDWVNKFTPDNIEQIKYNHIIKQKVFLHTPTGIQGLAFNMREEPFNDIRVRKALFMLFNREKMMEKLFFNEYQYMDSYYENSPYENKNNPIVRYNPEKAVELLEEAGYSQKNLNNEGYIVKNGKVMELTLNGYNSDTRVETLYQEELKNVGIKLNLNRVTWAKYLKDHDERNFKIAGVSWATTLFPNPQNSYLSNLADKKNTNNLWGLKNKRVDEICGIYNKEFDIKNRIKLIQELDSILTNEYMTILEWYNNNLRILYWNKFGTPEFTLSRFANEPTTSVIAYWWYDEKLAAELKKAKGKKIAMPGRPLEVKYWDKYDKKF